MATEEEEQTKERIQQLLTGFLKLKTEREHQRTAVNALKIDTQWREIFREAKSKELRDELIQMKEAFVKAVDYKDAIIDALQQEIEQTEVQNMWTVCTHMQSLNKLIAFEHQRSENLRQQYEKDLSDLRELYNETKREAEKYFKGEMDWFKDLQFIEKTIFKDFSEKTKMQFISMQEEVDEEVSKEKADVLETFDSHISTTWKQFQSALVKYLEDADAMEKMFAEMKEEYKASMLDAQQDRNVTEELRRSIPQLKAQIEERKKDHKERIQKILSGHEDFYSDAANLKEKIAKVQKHDKTSLTNLIINSGNAINELRKLLDKGQKIIKLYERCQKLEAQIQEISSDEPDLSQEEQEQISASLKFQLPPDLNLDESCEYIGLLEKFWAKYNRVYLRNLALKHELSDLQLLNRQLKSDMSRFMKDVADKKAESSKKWKLTDVKPTIQEAAHLAKKIPGSE